MGSRLFRCQKGETGQRFFEEPAGFPVPKKLRRAKKSEIERRDNSPRFGSVSRTALGGTAFGARAKEGCLTYEEHRPEGCRESNKRRINGGGVGFDRIPFPGSAAGAFPPEVAPYGATSGRHPFSEELHGPCSGFVLPEMAEDLLEEPGTHKEKFIEGFFALTFQVGSAGQENELLSHQKPFHQVI